MAILDIFVSVEQNLFVYFYMMKYLLQQHCRTNRSCGLGPYYQSEGRTLDRQARLHTVGFGLAKGRRPDRQSTCRGWPKASLLYGTQVMRVRIDGPTVVNISSSFFYGPPP